MTTRDRSTRGRRLAFWLTPALSVVLAVAGHAQDAVCWNEYTRYRQFKASDTSAAALSARAEAFRIWRSCVDATDSVRMHRAVQAAKSEFARLTIPFEVPENHDEGRLPVAAGSSDLGPMAYIFASPMLGSFTRKAQIEEHPLPGALVAMVVVEPLPGEPIPAATYGRLGLTAGKNCVWLQVPLGTTRYKARVNHANASGVCERNLTVAPWTGPELDVAEVAYPQFRFSEQYPAVARFDVDRNGYPVLAFKCLAAFCEAGTTAPRRSWEHPTPSEESAGRPPAQRYIKGWHDEQELAERYADASGMIKWRSSGIRASIVPDEDISDHDYSDFKVTHNNEWFGIGRIYIAGLTAGHKYATWGLQNGVNYVGLRYDAARDTLVIGIFTNPLPNAPTASITPRKTWLVQARMVHFDAGVPGTMRFRFTVGDDGIWTPCGEACCKADGEIQ